MFSGLFAKAQTKATGLLAKVRESLLKSSLSILVFVGILCENLVVLRASTRRRRFHFVMPIVVLFSLPVNIPGLQHVCQAAATAGQLLSRANNTHVTRVVER